MTTDASAGNTIARLDVSTKLAYERTYLAHEGTQMGWVRTALALISFGFTIAKFFEFLHEKRGEARAPLMAPPTVGILMIAIGLIALLLASLQHRRSPKALRDRCPDLPASLAGVTAVLIALLGILALVGAILRQ